MVARKRWRRGDNACSTIDVYKQKDRQANTPEDGMREILRALIPTVRFDNNNNNNNNSNNNRMLNFSN